MAEPEQSSSGLAARLDAFSLVTGRVASWLTLLMVLVTLVVVVLRYAFDVGFIWLQESLTWLHAAAFMLGAAYTLQQDEHVRVDIFYREMSAKRRAVVDGFGVLLFIMPLCAFLFVESFEYVRAAWTIGEVSRDSGGLPYPAIPLLKSMLLVMPAAVALQAFAMLLRAVAVLKR